MDRFWTFVQSMTFWNWIALIAFIFFPLSALNAFFSLRSRYLDWRGTKSKKEFERRVIQLEGKVAKVEEFEKNPTKFFGYALEKAVTILVFFLSGEFFFMTGSVFDSSSFGLLRLTEFPAGLLFIIAILCTFMSVIDAIKLSTVVRMVYYPAILAKEVFAFVANGRAKGLIIDPESKLMSDEIVIRAHQKNHP